MSRFLTLLFALCAVLVCFAPLTQAERSLKDASATPAPSEGDDGVLEGEGEGATVATPAADEGADGVLEGNGEGQTVPAADEGADGVFEGGGEGTTTTEEGVPAPDEGDDGVLEGNGEAEESSANTMVMSLGAVTAAAAAIVLV